jgi:hypothetical protein
LTDPEGKPLDAPLDLETPLVYGFAAAPDRSGALLRAQNECLQRLAFLWREESPSAEPQPSKTPDYHKESFLAGNAVGTARLARG